MAVVGLLHSQQFRLQDAQAQHFGAQFLKSPQVVEGVSCDLAEHDILEVHEGARRQSDRESAIVGILFADAGQETRAVVVQLEGLVPELGAEDRAVSCLHAPHLNEAPLHESADGGVHQRQRPVLILSRSQQQLLEVLGGLGHDVFEELDYRVATLK